MREQGGCGSGHRGSTSGQLKGRSRSRRSASRETCRQIAKCMGASTRLCWRTAEITIRTGPRCSRATPPSRMLKASGIVLDQDAFGENLPFIGLAEEDVCIGDRWRLGEVKNEVSATTSATSQHAARRWSRPHISEGSCATRGWTSWYLRVITPVTLSAG